MSIRLPFAIAIALAACHAAPAVHPGPDARAPRVVVLISATAEWKALTGRLAASASHASADTPFGPWFVHPLGGTDVVFFHGGYGKVAAGGSTQYAIDRWHPALLVNLGTCGGFGGTRKVGDVMLATETYLYDVVELMGDPDEAIEDFHTRLDVRWPARLAGRVVAGPLVSADRDLDPGAIDRLQTRFHASAGDWESAAIAWVAARNRTPLIILRAVTDVIDAAGHNPTYRAVEVWQRESIAAMATLVSLLDEALPDLTR